MQEPGSHAASAADCRHAQPDDLHAQPDGAYAQADGAHAQPDGAHAQPDGAYAQADGAHALVSGRVKWFDAVRGYGFVVPDDGGSDVLLHYNLLAPHGRKSLPEGALVTAEVCQGERGRAASAIVSIDLASAVGTHQELPPRPADRLDPADFLAGAGDYVPVQVRWFNRTKGYGFLLGDDGVTEVFIHMETVRRGGFDMLEPGQHICARISQGPRGALAVAVEPASALHG